MQHLGRRHRLDDRPPTGVFAYWPRWITARRLAAWRVRDPAWVAGLERVARIGGFNLQLDEDGL